eukprot:gb/GFBE01018684.1/.p1 GENE.gb/GFBE01018684.1/~~gb/GFBE01018684.1/.p1  ORF type:complete len:191 (+),score=14.90 gb/GFBE01018684.1/:1-573(+)
MLAAIAGSAVRRLGLTRTSACHAPSVTPSLAASSLASLNRLGSFSAWGLCSSRPLAETPLMVPGVAGAWFQVRAFGGWRRESGPAVSQSNFAPYPMVPYGVKRSAAYKESKKAARKAAERSRRAAEEKGMLLDPKKQLRMELKRNSGIGWYRAGQIIKHLEMHERGKGPPIDQAMRDRITDIAKVVRMGK